MTIDVGLPIFFLLHLNRQIEVSDCAVRTKYRGIPWRVLDRIIVALLRFCQPKCARGTELSGGATADEVGFRGEGLVCWEASRLVAL